MGNVVQVNIAAEMASKLGLNTGDTLGLVEVDGQFLAFPPVDYPKEVGDNVERKAKEVLANLAAEPNTAFDKINAGPAALEAQSEMLRIEGCSYPRDLQPGKSQKRSGTHGKNAVDQNAAFISFNIPDMLEGKDEKHDQQLPGDEVNTMSSVTGCRANPTLSHNAKQLL